MKIFSKIWSLSPQDIFLYDDKLYEVVAGRENHRLCCGVSDGENRVFESGISVEVIVCKIDHFRFSKIDELKSETSTTVDLSNKFLEL